MPPIFTFTWLRYPLEPFVPAVQAYLSHFSLRSLTTKPSVHSLLSLAAPAPQFCRSPQSSHSPLPLAAAVRSCNLLPLASVRSPQSAVQVRSLSPLAAAVRHCSNHCLTLLAAVRHRSVLPLATVCSPQSALVCRSPCTKKF